MSFRTLTSWDIKPNWPASWGTSGTLVITLDRGVVGTDSVEYPRTQNVGRPLSTLGFHFESAITVSSGTGTCASIANLPTTDTAIPVNTARYNIYIYDSKGKMRETLGTSFHLHESVNGSTTSFTWKQWVVAQQFSQGNSDLPMIGDRATFQAMLDATTYSHASDVVEGITYLDAAPAVSSHPEAVGSNSPKIISSLTYAAMTALTAITGLIKNATDRFRGLYYKTKVGVWSSLTGYSNVLDFDFVGDGTTDNRTALNNQITVLTTTGGTIYFPHDSNAANTDYLIGSSISVPANIILKFAPGARMRVANGAVVTILGSVDAGRYQIFSLPNETTGTGVVRFSAADFQTVTARMGVIYPQWWGAIGDNSNDDTLSLQRCINAATGLPLDATGTPRWADKAIDLGSGYIYKVQAASAGTSALTILGVVGFSMYGGGQENSIIRGYGGTFATPFDAVLDLDGVFEGTFQNFQVEGWTGSNYKFLIYYRREPTLSGRGSSATKFLHVKAGGVWIAAAWQIGGSGYFDGYQEDNTLFTGCSARGAWVSGSSYWQHGWYIGTGQFANNLNHTIIGLDAVLVRNAVTVSQSNVQVYGGEVAGADIMFNFVGGGTQGYSKVDGLRAEGVRKLIEWPATYPVFFAASFSNIEMRANYLALDAVSGKPDWIHFGGSSLSLMNIRVLDQPRVEDTATSGSTTTLVKTGAGWVVNAYTGYAIELISGTGAGQESYVTSNTATTLTISPALVTAPDATTGFRILLRPSINAESNALVLVDGVGVEGARLENAFVLGLQATALIRNFSELDTGPNVRVEWANLTLVDGQRDLVPIASYGTGGSLPNIKIVRSAGNTIGLSSFAAPTGRIQRLGTAAAPVLQNNTAGGATSYTYYLVPKYANGTKGLPSTGATVAGCTAALSEANYIRIYAPLPADSLPIVAYDILKGTTSFSIALDVPVERMRNFRDTGQTPAAYTPATVDPSGVFTVDGFLLQGEGATLSVSGNAVAPTHAIHKINDAGGLIKNITLPSGFTSGSITLVAGVTPYTTDATGNIGRAVSPATGQAVTYTYSAAATKWYPNI